VVVFEKRVLHRREYRNSSPERRRSIPVRGGKPGFFFKNKIRIFVFIGLYGFLWFLLCLNNTTPKTLKN